MAKTIKNLPYQLYRFINYFECPPKEGMCCDECGTYITHVCQVKGQDGNIFNLGTTCIEKINKKRDGTFLTIKDCNAITRREKEYKTARKILKELKEYKSGKVQKYFEMNNDGVITWNDLDNPKIFGKEKSWVEFNGGIKRTFTKTWKSEDILVCARFDGSMFQLRFEILCDNGSFPSTEWFTPGFVPNYMELFGEFISDKNKWINPEVYDVKNSKEAKEKFNDAYDSFGNYLESHNSDWLKKHQEWDFNKWIKE